MKNFYQPMLIGPISLSILGQVLGEGTKLESEAKRPIIELSETLQELGISIRQSAYDQSTLQKPAQLQFVLPNEGRDSYLIDAGITWNLSDLTGSSINFENGTAEFSILAEYHRNTLTTSEKNSFQTGGLLTASFGDVASPTDHLIHLIDLKTVYKRDRVGGSHGFLGTLTYWPLVPRFAGTGYNYPNIGGYWGPEWLVIMTQPGFGVQFEHASNVDKIGKGGETWRGKASLDVAAYPFANILERNPASEIGPVEIALSYCRWSNWAGSGGFNARDSNHELFTASLNYYFGPFSELIKQRPFAIGVDYVKGENPEEGFKDDDYWQLSFKAMF